MIHRNNPKHKIFRFDIQSEMATKTEFKTVVKRRVVRGTDGENGERERERGRFFNFFLSSFLSKIYENRTVGFRRSIRQS